MCWDYHLVNKWTCLNKYAMPLSKEIFDTIRQVKVFNTLWFNYRLLLLKKGDKVKITFWGIDLHGKVICMDWSFCDLVWIIPFLQIFKRSMLRLKQSHKFPNQWILVVYELSYSSLPICPIHIFSSDTQACFALITPYNMTCFALVTSPNIPSNVLHTPL
jgi:hypothetical protein